MHRSITNFCHIWMMRINIHMSELYFWFNVTGVDSWQWRHIDVMESQITGASTVFELFVQAHIKENIKAPRHWPVDSPHRGSVTRKCFHLMTSSCSGINLCNDLIYISQQFSITFISNMCVISQLDVVDIMKAPCLWWDNYGLGGWYHVITCIYSAYMYVKNCISNFCNRE